MLLEKVFFTIAKNYSWPKEGFLYKHSTLDFGIWDAPFIYFYCSGNTFIAVFKQNDTLRL